MELLNKETKLLKIKNSLQKNKSWKRGRTLLFKRKIRVLK